QRGGPRVDAIEPHPAPQLRAHDEEQQQQRDDAELELPDHLDVLGQVDLFGLREQESGHCAAPFCAAAARSREAFSSCHVRWYRPLYEWLPSGNPYRFRSLSGSWACRVTLQRIVSSSV